MAAVNSIQRVKLLERDEIMRRLTRMRGESDKRRDNEITLYDLARYMSVTRWTIQKHMQGKDPINDMWQLLYSQTFAMMDEGTLVLRYISGGEDNRRKTKILVRVAKPAAPPKREVRPFIQFGPVPKLKFD